MEIPNYDVDNKNKKFKQLYSFMPNDTFRMLICGNSGSGKTNLLYHMLIEPVTITKQAVRYQNINLYFKPRTELLHVFAMIQQWPTHEARVSRDALRPQETQHFM